MPIEIFSISDEQYEKITFLQEGHFLDIKRKEIAPSKLTTTLSGFANADGGEIFIGLEEAEAPLFPHVWNGFATAEDANAHIQIFDELFPLGDDYTYNFLEHTGSRGLILQIIVRKTRRVVNAKDGIPRVRRGAQNLQYNTPEKLIELERIKGITSFENEPVNVDLANITNSETIVRFMLDVVPTREPEPWIRQNELIKNDKPTVAGIILFADLPQAILPKHSGIKIYHYSSINEEGERETLQGNPLTIEGSAIDLIQSAVKKTQEIISSIKIVGVNGLEAVEYPTETLHEVITNAILHRDYAFADDVHVRIFDNRVEVESPGRLPGHMTVKNIYDERFARNGNIVRVINKFPDPPNKDIGEGLNTARNALLSVRLKEPVFIEKEHSFLVQINHQRLASPETLVEAFLNNNDEITNREARKLTGIKSENSMKNVFYRLRDLGIIEPVPGKSGFGAAWRKTREKN